MLTLPVLRPTQCLHYLELGERNRAFAFTALNAHSSRSHAVVMVTVVKSRKVWPHGGRQGGYLGVLCIAAYWRFVQPHHWGAGSGCMGVSYVMEHSRKKTGKS